MLELIILVLNILILLSLIYIYSTKEKYQGGDICAICGDLLKDPNTPNIPLIKTYCGHIFHETCLNQWLYRANFCPLCRREFHPFLGPTQPPPINLPPPSEIFLPQGSPLYPDGTGGQYSSPLYPIGAGEQQGPIYFVDDPSSFPSSSSSYIPQILFDPSLPLFQPPADSPGYLNIESPEQSPFTQETQGYLPPPPKGGMFR